MKTAPRQIVAFGGGGFSMESGNPLLDASGQPVVEMRIATAYPGDRDAAPVAPLPEALSTSVAA